MENNSFRCHFSIVFENLGSTFYAICVMLVLNLDNPDELMKDLIAGNVEVVGALVVLAILFAILLLFFIITVVVWSKTWISIEGDSIVIEKKTLNRKKNTIGMKNISNINMEQNLFERLMGTCKVKMDTNSKTTAESTDVKIVLKKDKAEAFRKLIMAHMNEQAVEVEVSKKVDEEDYDVAYTFKDIVLHCCYTASVISILLLLAFLIGAVVGIHAVRVGDVLLDGIVNVLGSLLTLGIVLFSVVHSLVKDFFVYYNFRAKRRGDKIYLSYGLLKKRNYVLSVDKINAVKVTAPLISRILGRQYVEVVCIGLGDEDGEKSLLLLSESRQGMQDKLSLLLPEFLIEEPNLIRRKKNTLCGELICTFVTAVVIFIAVHYLPDLLEISDTWAGIVSVFVFLFALLFWCAWIYMLLRTEGISVGDEILAISSGAFAKRIVWIPYQRIQSMVFSQGPVARHFGYAKGTVQILASVVNSSHAISCFDTDIYRQIQERMLVRKGKKLQEMV